MSASIISQPSVTVTLANADGTVAPAVQRVLLVGQKTSVGTAPDGDLVTNISSSGAPENALFGEDSMLAAMIRGFKKVNQIVQIDAIPLDDAVGTPRLVDFTVAGTATAAGTITVTVGSVVDHEFEVAIANAATETTVAAAIVAAVNADTKVPFTASNVAGAVSLTAVNDGTVANDLGIEVVVAAAGITVASVAETTPGATDPTLTGILDVATGRYQGIVWPYADTSVLRTFLTPRFNPTNAILDGVGFVTIQDTHSNHLTTLNALNDQDLVVFAEKQESETLYLGPSQNEASYVKSAIFAGVRALRLTAGASIAQFLTSSASLDQFGGPALASLPYFNTPLSDLPTIKPGRGWTDTEIEQLFDAGGAVIGVNTGGTSALVGEVVTTFKTDAASNPDPTFQFLNFVDTASQAREYFFSNLRSRFAQSRLTEGSVTRGRDMANSVIIRAFCEQLYQDLSGADFVLTQAGEAAIVFFKNNLVITIALATGTVTITMLVPIVTQLRVINATFKIAFSTTG